MSDMDGPTEEEVRRWERLGAGLIYLGAFTGLLALGVCPQWLQFTIAGAFIFLGLFFFVGVTLGRRDLRKKSTG